MEQGAIAYNQDVLLREIRVQYEVFSLWRNGYLFVTIVVLDMSLNSISRWYRHSPENPGSCEIATPALAAVRVLEVGENFSFQRWW